MEIKKDFKPFIGQKSDTYEERVDSDRIKRFCAAIGRPVLLGSDKVLEAPPTYLTLFRRGEFELFEKLGLELRQILHAEQEYFYQGKLLANDEVRFETQIVTAHSKKSADAAKPSLHFLTLETTIEATREGTKVGQVATSKTTIVVRT